MKTVVTVPTYDERENVGPLIEALLALPVEDLEVVVVDDDSPDGTWRVVEEYAGRPGARVHLVRRTRERGRGHAGKAGFELALERGAERVVEMDGDFSHDPAAIPELLAALEDGDLVLGSRGVGGAADVERGLARRVLTRCANAYARLLLGVRVRDCNSGFRAYRREVLVAVVPKLRAAGPAIVHEVLFHAHRAGFRIREVPIAFRERAGGESKLGWRQLLAGCLHVLQLRLRG